MASILRSAWDPTLRSGRIDAVSSSVGFCPSLMSTTDRFRLGEMRAELNPYAPGAGLRPPELVGRQPEVDAFDLLVARSRRGQTSRSLVLHGLRGVGKTVLLNQFRAQADSAGWLVVDVEGQTSDSGQQTTRRRLAREIALAARRLHRGRALTSAVRDALATVKAFSVQFGGMGFSVDVEASVGRADTGVIEIDLEELVEDLAPALREQQRVLALFVDELQDLEPALLAALISVQHRAGQREWPFVVVGAGLPSVPGALTSAKSYAERLFDYREIGSLPSGAAADALVLPAQRSGVTFDPDALDTIVDAAGGYPYFLQTYGSAAWDLAADKRITRADADGAIERGNAELDSGFFPGRWASATPAERQYLVAMSDDPEGESSTGEVASRLGVPAKATSQARQALIGKGIVFAPQRGRIAYTVPHMRAFVRRQADLDLVD